MNAEQLQQYIDKEKCKRRRLDLLEELIFMVENIGEQSSDQLQDICQRLRKMLSPSIVIGPDSYFFEFYVQGKKFCVVTPKQIYYIRKNKELLKFMETASLIFTILYRNISVDQSFVLEDIPDPYGLIRHEDRLLEFFAILMGMNFVGKY